MAEVAAPASPAQKAGGKFARFMKGAAKKAGGDGMAAAKGGMNVAGKMADKTGAKKLGYFTKHLTEGHRAEYMGEFIGTFVICMVVGFALQLAGPYYPWAAGAAYTVMFYSVGDMGGGHFNPAVTVCFILVKPGERLKQLPMWVLYMGSQFGAAILAYTCRKMVLPEANNGKLIETAEESNLMQTVAVEMVFAFFLCTAFMSFDCGRMKYAQSEGVTYGYVVIAAIICSASVSGGAINPFVFFAVNGLNKIDEFIMYLAAHGAGAAAAAFFYRVINRDMFGSKITLAEQAVAEFLGTFFLTVTLGFAALNDSTGAVGIAVGSALMVCVYAFGTVSGGFFNPAVTLGVFLSGRRAMTAKQFFTYIAVQFAGGLAAGIYYVTAMKNSIAPGYGAQANNNYVSLAMAEMVFTGYLVFVVLGGFVDNPAHWRIDFGGYALGAVIWVGALAVASISGAHFNPAISLGVCFGWSLRPENEQNNLHGQTNEKWMEVMMWYWFGQWLGVLMGTCQLFVTRPQEIMWPTFMTADEAKEKSNRKVRKPAGQVDPKKAALGQDDAVADHPEPKVDEAGGGQETAEMAAFEGSPVNNSAIKL